MLIEALALSSGRPYEGDTAISIIRREGFPPTQTQHSHIPHAYGCPCCSNISPRRRRQEAVVQAEENERRRRLQWDVYEERAKGECNIRASGSGGGGGGSVPGRNTLRKFYATLQRPLQYDTKSLFNPPPPQTLAALRGDSSTPMVGGGGVSGASLNSSIPLQPFSQQSTVDRDMRPPLCRDNAQLCITLHHGSGFRDSTVDHGVRGQVYVQLRYGVIEGITRAVHVDADGTASWNQSFDLPLQDINTPIELFVIDSSARFSQTANDCVVGGLMVANQHLSWDEFRADHVDFALSRFDAYGAASVDEEKPMFLTVSWEVLRRPEEGDNEQRVDSTNASWLDNADKSIPKLAQPRNSENAKSSAVRFTDNRHEAGDVPFVIEIARVLVFPSSQGSTAADALLFTPETLYAMIQTPDGECTEYVTLVRQQQQQRSTHQNDDHDVAVVEHSKKETSKSYEVSQHSGNTCSGSYVQHAAPLPTSAAGEIEAAEEEEEPPQQEPLLHILLCCNDNEQVNDPSSSSSSHALPEGAALRVVASTTIRPSALQSKGTGTFIVDRVIDDEHVDDVNHAKISAWGEIVVHWNFDVNNHRSRRTHQGDGSKTTPNPVFPQPHFDDSGFVVPPDADLDPQSLDIDVLSVIVVRGIDLQQTDYSADAETSTSTTNVITKRLHSPLIIVGVGPLSASTPTAAVHRNVGPCNVIWNQELVFPLGERVAWDPKRIEVILEENHEIVSFGRFSIAEALDSRGILQCDAGSVSEGFEVVPLTQEGYPAALGHVLVRWRYARYDRAASRSRRQRSQGTTTATSLEDKDVDHQDLVDEKQTEEEVVVEQEDREPLVPTRADTPDRELSMPKAEQPSPRAVQRESVPRQDSEERVVPVSPSPPKTASLFNGAAVSSPGKGASPSSVAGSPQGPSAFSIDEMPHRRSILTSDDAVEAAHREHAADGSVFYANDAEDGGAIDAVPKMIAPPAPAEAHTDSSLSAGVGQSQPRFVFAIRKVDGQPRIGFYDPSTAPQVIDPNDEAAKDTKEDQGDEEACTSDVPMNGPEPDGTLFGKGVESSWTDEQHPETHLTSAQEQEEKARALLREELEAKCTIAKAQRKRNVVNRKLVWPTQPWYPPGESRDESHVPLSRRESERKQVDTIIELSLKSRFVAQHTQSQLSAPRSLSGGRQSKPQNNQQGTSRSTTPSPQPLQN